MLRSLLVDRFKLAYHDDMREMPVFALIRPRRDGQLGPHLARSDSNCAAQADGSPRRCEFTIAIGNVHGHGMSMELLAMTLSGFSTRVVVDRTELTGPLDFDLTWGADPGGASLFTAVEEQLGLKLEATRAPVRVLVIDHAEKPTAD